MVHLCVGVATTSVVIEIRGQLELPRQLHISIDASVEVEAVDVLEILALTSCAVPCQLEFAAYPYLFVVELEAEGNGHVVRADRAAHWYRRIRGL